LVHYTFPQAADQTDIQWQNSVTLLCDQ